jgi:hypothetical protein
MALTGSFVLFGSRGFQQSERVKDLRLIAVVQAPGYGWSHRALKPCQAGIVIRTAGETWT